MEGYIEVIATHNIIEFGLMESILRQNQIEYVTRDELTVQVDPLYANAIGGAKLLVAAEDLAFAKELLSGAGYDDQMKNTEDQIFPFMKKMESFAQKIPFFKNFRSELQLVILFTVLALLVALAAYFLVIEFKLYE